MHPSLSARRSWLPLLLSAALVACGGSDPTSPEPTGTPAAVAAVAGTTPQTAAAGTAVAAAPAVLVTDAAGQPVANVAVAFAVTSGGGSLGATSAQTNADGVASAGAWTLGAAPGENVVTATVGALPPVRFTATGTAGVTMLAAAQLDVAGRAYQCARQASGAVLCWGENGAAQLGDGTTTFRELPVAVAANGVTFAQVRLGTLHGCALDAQGAAHCWGVNTTGAVGDGTATNRATPVAVTGGHAFASLALSETYSCGLKADGSVWCWGVRAGGTTAERRMEPTRLNDGGRQIVALAVSRTQVCGAVAGGGTVCWAGNVFASAPTTLNAGLAFAQLSAGTAHFCGLTGDGRAYCWGLNNRMQLGDGTPVESRASAVAVAGDVRYTDLNAGGEHTCAVATTGVAYCWGYNLYGQLGVDQPPSAILVSPTPQRVVAPAGVSFASISAGGTGSCGIATTNQVYCWGGRAFDNAGTQLLAELKPVAVRER